MCVLLVVLGYKNLDFRTYLDQKSILFLWSKALMISMLSAIFFFCVFLTVQPFMCALLVVLGYKNLDFRT
jgi:hypothetical protein